MKYESCDSYAFAVFLFVLMVLSFFGSLWLAPFPTRSDWAYVAPCQGQYCVNIHGPKNIQISRPLPLGEAKQLADDYNKLVEGKNIVEK